MDVPEFGACTPPSFFLKQEDDMEMMDFLDLDEYEKGKPGSVMEPKLSGQQSVPGTFLTPSNSTSVSSNVSPDGRAYMDVWPLRSEEVSAEKAGAVGSSMSQYYSAGGVTAGNSSVISTQPSNDSYHSAQQELSALKFGRIYDNSSSLDEELRSALNCHEDWTEVLKNANCEQYKYQLYVGGLPLRSRVETQIKCRLVLSPSPSQHLLHLPWDTISRPRFQLREKFAPRSNVLQLEVDVVSASNPRQPLRMCDKCLNREKKRAFRKKNLDASEQRYWSDGRIRRLAIFNCKEIVSIPLEKPCTVENSNYANATSNSNINEDNIKSLKHNDFASIDPIDNENSSKPDCATSVIQGREIYLPLRLACYSRHHSAKNGYRDNQGSIVARTVTNPILISDDNKEIKLSEDGSLSAGMSSAGRAPSNAENPFGFSATDQSSLSMEDSSDVSSSSLKRRRESDWSGSIRVQPLTSITPTPVNNNKGQFSSPSYNRPTTSASVKVEVLSPSATSPDAPISSSSRVPSTTSMSPNVSNTGVVLPQIQRVIPSQGSVRGGIEVTLLGTGFQSGLIASFGDVRASYTQCWSDSTIVTQLPPSATTGPVIVSFEGYTHSMPQIFTYVDDTDRQLIELALQVVGLKMSGKLEDARNIAMRIVGSKDQDRNSNSQSGKAEGSTHDFSGFSTTSNNPHENVILRCIEVAVIEEGLPNWQVRNSEGQTMLHLAAALGYSKIIVALLSQGARVDLQDVNGMTPLHFAALNGHRLVIQQLLRCQSNPFNRTFAGFTVMDIAQDYVEDLLPIGMRYREYQEMIKEARSSSSSTLSSMMSVNENIRPLTSYSGGGLERSASGISLLHSYEYTDEEWGFSSSSESEEDLLGDVRSAMRAVRPSSRSGGDEVQFVEHLNHGVDGSNPDLGVRVSNAAENVSKYISQLTINAKNKMHWDNWDDVFNYLYKRRETSRHILIDTTDSGSSPETIHPGASDSDATVAPPEVGKSPQVFWKRYFKPPPPRYDDLFPDPKSDGNTSKVSLLPTSTEQPQHQQQDLLDDQQVDEQASYEQQFLQIFFNNRKQLRNDRMLFFFWLPVLLTILMIFGLRIAGYSPGEYFSDFGNRIREIASYMFLGKKGTLPCSTSQRTTLISV